MKKTDLHILMLEDDPLDAELNKSQLLLLEEYNCVVDLTTDKNTYLRKLETCLPDIILSDYNLPNYNGLQALNDLKERNMLVPFIFVTGAMDEETAADAIKAGAWDYVVKDRLFRLPLAVRSVLKLKEEKEITAKAEAKTQRLLTAIEQTSVQIIVTNNQGIIEYVNKKFTEITGVELEGAVGKEAISFSPGNLNAATISNAVEKINKGEVYRGEIQSITTGGTPCWESISITPITSAGGQIINFVAVKEDITLRKKMERDIIEARDRAEKSDKLKEAFLQNLSHEIRTPLNAIVGFSDLISCSEFDVNKFTGYASIIKHSSNQLLTIVTDILTISRIQTGQETITSKPADIHKLFDELWEMYKPLADQKGIGLVIEKNMSTGTPYMVTDKPKLLQILCNLLDNAIKFTQEGLVELRYFIKDNLIEFRVKDSGIGIPEEEQAHIFERFRQAEPFIQINYGGMGLGLSIALSFAQMMGGSINVYSAPGRGSEFCLSLPYVPHNIDARKGGSSLPNRPLTILVAEDEINNFLLIQAILLDKNIALVHARNGCEALDACEANPAIDLVLMDLKMPVMDGISSMKEIKKTRGDLPVIAQTAFGTENERQHFLDLGFDDYISKPINKDVLLELIIKSLQ